MGDRGEHLAGGAVVVADGRDAEPDGVQRQGEHEEGGRWHGLLRRILDRMHRGAAAVAGAGRAALHQGVHPQRRQLGVADPVLWRVLPAVPG